jgi:hypothetical protein
MLSPTQVKSDGTVYLTVLKIILLLSSMAVSIAAIAISNGSSNCISTYAGISFNYNTWLLVYGVINISVTIFLFSTFLIILVSSSEILFIQWAVIYLLNSLFNFSWYIVGSILYFSTVHNNTCQDQNLSLYQFGLVLFIIQTISFSIDLLSSKRDK